MEVFGNYSEYYNLLYQDKDYEAESSYIESLIKKFNADTKKIFEMGCGTGKHANLLNRKGYSVFGIDSSKTMLEQAKKLGINCTFGDVRNYRAKEVFDTVLALFHVISYQITDEDVSDFFETAAIHLNKGGLFVFDSWYKPAVLAQVPEKRVKELENNEISVKRFCEPNHLIEHSVVEVNYKIVITDKKTDKQEIILEKHSMRYFSLDELKEFAAKKGIKIIHSEEWLTKAIPSENTWGVTFVGEKL